MSNVVNYQIVICKSLSKGMSLNFHETSKEDQVDIKVQNLKKGKITFRVKIMLCIPPVFPEDYSLSL